METESHPLVYDTIGPNYNGHRRPDPRIAAQILAALGNAESICNVGAGSGSYEPFDRTVTAVEPSLEMIHQRRSDARVVRATAEDLPFADGEFDASMAVLTVHHWLDPQKGLAEMCRVSGTQVVLAFDPSMIDSLWLVRDYIPEIVEFEQRRSIAIESIADSLQATSIETVMIPWDCSDGFQAAYWRRPEHYLNPDVRAAISTLAQLPANVVSWGINRLEDDLRTGQWEHSYSSLRQVDEMDFGYRLIVSESVR